MLRVYTQAHSWARRQRQQRDDIKARGSGEPARDDEYWAKLAMPKVADQSDPYNVEVHPKAMKLRDQYAEFHQYWGFDGRLLERVLPLNTKNVNLFMTSFAPETTGWPTPGEHTAKAMKYIDVHLRGRHHERWE